MLTVQTLKDLPLNESPRLEPKFRDAFASPDPRWLPTLLRR
jgi:hypothetical protein